MPQGQRDPKRPPRSPQQKSVAFDVDAVEPLQSDDSETVTAIPPVVTTELHAPPATAVQETQVITRKFTRVTPNTAPPPASERFTEPEDEDGDEDKRLPSGFEFVEEDDDADPVGRFMLSIGGEDVSGLRVSIKRMPDTFEMRGKFRQPASVAIQHGDIPFDADNLINNIRDTLGGGLYRLSIKRSGGQFFTRPIEVLIADPPGSTPVSGNPAAQTARQAKPTDPLDDLIAQAEKFNRLKEALGMSNGGSTNGNGAPTSPDADAALAQALIKQPAVLESLINGMVNKFKAGDGEREPWYKDLLSSLLNNQETAALLVHGGFGLLGSLTELIKKGAGTLAGAASVATKPLELAAATLPPGTNTEQEPNGAQFVYNSREEAITALSSGDTETMDTDAEEPAHLTILDFLINDKLRNNSPITASEAWITEMYERWPDEVAQAESMLLMMPPKTIKLILIGIDPAYQETLELPHADQFLINLQQLVKARKGDIQNGMV